MKTREQAEARAMELYPDTQSSDYLWTVRAQQRQAFLQCWEEMQQNKQTCGFCVEPKQEEEKPQPQERDVKKLAIEFLEETGIDIPANYKETYAGSLVEFYNAKIKNTIQDNGLLTVKQAESICIGFYNDLVGHLESGLSTELFHGEIVFNKHLEKALK